MADISGVWSDNELCISVLDKNAYIVNKNNPLSSCRRSISHVDPVFLLKSDQNTHFIVAQKTVTPFDDGTRLFSNTKIYFLSKSGRIDNSTEFLKLIVLKGDALKLVIFRIKKFYKHNILRIALKLCFNMHHFCLFL